METNLQWDYVAAGGSLLLVADQDDKGSSCPTVEVMHGLLETKSSHSYLLPPGTPASTLSRREVSTSLTPSWVSISQNKLEAELRPMEETRMALCNICSQYGRRVDSLLSGYWEDCNNLQNGVPPCVVSIYLFYVWTWNSLLAFISWFVRLCDRLGFILMEPGLPYKGPYIDIKKMYFKNT
jgi:hypothetical protein